MDEKNVVHNHYVNENEVIDVIGKWMELEKIIWTQVTQTQKHKWHMFSVICGYRLQIFRYEYIIWSNYRNLESEKEDGGRADRRNRDSHIKLQTIWGRK